MSSVAMNTIGLSITTVGVQVNLKRFDVRAIIVPFSKSSLLIEKEARLVSTTLMLKEDSLFRVTINATGPVTFGGLLAAV